MEPFVRVHGGVVPMNRVNVDTDQIIPKQFLKRVERDGFGQFLFNDWRYNADGFADIFNGNCFQNGILPVILPEETVQQIIEKAEKDPGYKLHVDLEAQRVWDDSEEVVATFDLEPFRRYSLLNGLDDIGLTMEREDDISKFESQRGIHGGVVTG